jgi:hypothetical protein
VERIERHDWINAIGLAAVLMSIALLLILGARALFDTVGDGLVASSRPDPPATTVPAEPDADAEPDPDAEAEADAEPEVEPEPELPPREPSEVTVRVANSAQRSGIAAAGGGRLSTLGYNVADLTNGPPLATSVVYYAEGYEREAQGVARALGVPEPAVQPVPPAPAVDASGVAVVVVLGADTTVG